MHFSIPLSLLFVAIARCIQSISVESSLIACETQWTKNRRDDAVITFVVPSLSRSTLPAALDSVMKQTDPKWLAVVVFDGLMSDSLYLNATSNLPIYYKELPSKIVNDGRVCFIHGPSDRQANCAALNRNHAIKSVKTRWIGFLDDDDTIDSKYVHYVIEHEKEYPDAQSILFRMCADVKSLGYLLPPATATNIIRQDVGISFAARTSLFQQSKYHFHHSNWEDFLFLYTLRVDKIPVLMSEHVVYYVRNFTVPQCYGPATRTYLTDQNATLYLRQAALMTEKQKELELKYAKLYECIDHRPVKLVPEFIFSESNNTIVQHNIRGLNTSLAAAIGRKCIGHWRRVDADVKIHLIFGATTPPISPYYIQIQTEHRDSLQVGVNYSNKLQNALQVWEFDHVGENMHTIPGVSTSKYFMPTMLMLDSNPVYQCSNVYKGFQTNIIDGKLAVDPKFEVYRQGVYYKCMVTGDGVRNIDYELSPCRSNITNDDASSYCFISPAVINDTEERHRLCRNIVFPPKSLSYFMNSASKHTDIDVLMFGTMRGSSSNERERICDALVAKGVNVVCVESTFDKLLEHLVCMSRVIVVSHYFHASALETVLIDPLLQIGKVVVATESLSTPDIDRLYRKVIPIVSKELLVDTVSNIVHNYENWISERQYEKNVTAFVQQAMSAIHPICLAISRLGAKIKDFKDQKKV